RESAHARDRVRRRHPPLHRPDVHARERVRRRSGIRLGASGARGRRRARRPHRAAARVGDRLREAVVRLRDRAYVQLRRQGGGGRRAAPPTPTAKLSCPATPWDVKCILDIFCKGDAEDREVVKKLPKLTIHKRETKHVHFKRFKSGVWEDDGFTSGGSALGRE